MNQHGCRDVRCRPTIPTVHVIVHDRSNRQRINAKVNGLDFSTVGVLYFLMYIALENVSEKKKYHSKNGLAALVRHEGHSHSSTVCSFTEEC